MGFDVFWDGDPVLPPPPTPSSSGQALTNGEHVKLNTWYIFLTFLSKTFKNNFYRDLRLFVLDGPSVLLLGHSTTYLCGRGRTGVVCHDDNNRGPGTTGDSTEVRTARTVATLCAPGKLGVWASSGPSDGTRT